jgi:hypothetical protein
MPKFLKCDEAFEKCLKDGCIIPLETIDIEKVRSTFAIAESDYNSASILKVNIVKDCKEWNSVYKLYYDALHELVESLLRFDKIKSDNHQCLFAYLCQKHPALELNWDFFEKFRTKRNGINYYGSPINHRDWKEIELEYDLHMNKLKTEIKKRLL